MLHLDLSTIQVYRLALVEALALGEKTHEALASDFGRTAQAVKQFSARNHGEIATRRQTLLVRWMLRVLIFGYRTGWCGGRGGRSCSRILRPFGRS